MDSSGDIGVGGGGGGGGVGEVGGGGGEGVGGVGEGGGAEEEHQLAVKITSTEKCLWPFYLSGRNIIAPVNERRRKMRGGMGLRGEMQKGRRRKKEGEGGGGE